jgi:hypothetical protein
VSRPFGLRPYLAGQTAQPSRRSSDSIRPSRHKESRLAESRSCGRTRKTALQLLTRVVTRHVQEVPLLSAASTAKGRLSSAIDSCLLNGFVASSLLTGNPALSLRLRAKVKSATGEENRIARLLTFMADASSGRYRLAEAQDNCVTLRGRHHEDQCLGTQGERTL